MIFTKKNGLSQHIFIHTLRLFNYHKKKVCPLQKRGLLTTKLEEMENNWSLQRQDMVTIKSHICTTKIENGKTIKDDGHHRKRML